MIERKYCKCCGQLISDINIEGTDFYRHIRIKYCPECRDMMQGNSDESSGLYLQL